MRAVRLQTAAVFLPAVLPGVVELVAAYAVNASELLYDLDESVRLVRGLRGFVVRGGKEIVRLADDACCGLLLGAAAVTSGSCGHVFGSALRRGRAPAFHPELAPLLGRSHLVSAVRAGVDGDPWATHTGMIDRRGRSIVFRYNHDSWDVAMTRLWMPKDDRHDASTAHWASKNRPAFLHDTGFYRRWPEELLMVDEDGWPVRPPRHGMVFGTAWDTTGHGDPDSDFFASVWDGMRGGHRLIYCTIERSARGTPMRIVVRGDPVRPIGQTLKQMRDRGLRTLDWHPEEIACVADSSYLVVRTGSHVLLYDLAADTASVLPVAPTAVATAIDVINADAVVAVTQRDREEHRAELRALPLPAHVRPPACAPECACRAAPADPAPPERPPASGAPPGNRAAFARCWCGAPRGHGRPLRVGSVGAAPSFDLARALAAVAAQDPFPRWGSVATGPACD